MAIKALNRIIESEKKCLEKLSYEIITIPVVCQKLQLN